MLRTVPGRYLKTLIFFPFAYAAGVGFALLIWLQDMSADPPIPLRAVPVVLLPIAYYCIAFKPVRRHYGRVTAYNIGLMMSFVPLFIAATLTGGYGSWHNLGIAILTFLTAMLGVPTMMLLVWFHLLGLLVGMSGIIPNYHVELWYIPLPLYLLAAFAGWSFFKKYYIGDPAGDTIATMLQNEQIRSESLVGAIQDGVVTINTKGIIEYCNDRILSMLGTTRAELVGHPVADKIIEYTKPGKHQDKLLKLFGIVQTTGQAVYYGMISLVKHGPNTTDISVSVVPVKNVDGEVTAHFILMYDMSHVGDLQRAIDEFISIASHEMRTPLTVIANYADTIKNAGVPGDTQHIAERIQEVSTELLALVNDMLDISKLESGKDNGTPAPVDVGSLARRLTDDFSRETQSRNITVATTIADNTMAFADATLLKRVLTNLLSNACKYTPDGGNVTISSVAAGDNIEVSITDSGVGIPTDKVAAIFEKFVRLESDRSTVTHGTGLGLPIVKKIVESWGGSIQVESDGRHGSRFYFTVPAYQKDKETT